MTSKLSITINSGRGQALPALCRYCTLALITIALCSCGNDTETDGGTPVVKVYGHTLYVDDVEHIVPDGLSPADSAQFVADYAKRWAEEILFYEKAKSNVADDGMIEKLVEDYRKNLVINYYQNRLIDEHLDGIISDDSVRAYYGRNHESLRIDRPVMKGVFIKLRKDSRYIKTARQLISRHDKRDELERLSLKAAAGYLYFRDQWMEPDAVADRSPFGPQLETMDRGGTMLETTDSSYTYLFYIDSLLPKGSEMPYGLAEKSIRETIRNEQKVAFIRSVKDDIYRSATEAGKVIYSTPQQ